MARPIYSHEVLDADFQWLMNHYCETHPSAIVIDHACLPIIIVLGEAKDKLIAEASNSPVPAAQAPASSDESVSEDQDQ
jgi:hypothetical protein